MSTIKEMLNQTLSETGFKQEQAFATSQTTEGQTMLALANREVNTLQKETWQELTRTMLLPLTTATEYDLPDDYRQFVFDTAWATNQEYKADFPVIPEGWAYLQSQDVATGFVYRIRIINNQIQIYNPQDGAELYAEYISKYAVSSGTGQAKERFTADDDTFGLNDDLMIMGVKWRFNKLKGMEWQADFAEWKKMYKSERATNISAQTLDFTRGAASPYVDPQADYYRPEGL
jgi:hypothetical protein